ncbi:MAG TPA: maltose ABC transporter substrate-binding protein [Paenibacillus sp.]|nr:maltose ABC transporter substrate-binding protein [Paenibacillus sp.]HUC93313.1 maltose ABC transporter substrate-binding protein [Paenibacillus sp.]
MEDICTCISEILKNYRKGGLVSMKLKRLLVLIFCFTMVFTLAACGSNNAAGNSGKSAATNNSGAANSAGDNAAAENNQAAEEEFKPEEGASLIVWDNKDKEGEWSKYVAEQFTKEYGIPVKVEEVGHTDAPTKLKTDGPAGLAADVFAAPHDRAGGMVAEGLVLENFYADEYQQDFMEAAINGTSVNGKMYGYPTNIETYALFYNKDLAAQAPQTFEELITQSKAFTDKSQNKYGFMMEPANFYFAYSIIGGFGGYVFGKDNTDPGDIGLNNEGAVKAGEFMLRLKKEILPLKNEDITYDVKQSLFNEGKLMFNIDGPWAVKGHKEAGVNFGVVPLPKLENGKVPTSFSGVKGFYVNAYTKYPEAASLYAKFATSEEMLLKRFEITGELPPRKSLLENETIKNDEIAAAFLTQAQFAVPMPNIPEMPAVWGPAGSALAAIWNEQSTPKEALDSGVQQIKEAIKIQKTEQ